MRKDIRVHNLSAVGRPAWTKGVNGRFGELHAAASIAVGFPENTFGKGYVSHEPTIVREGHRFCRNATQEGAELFALRVRAGKFAPRVGTHGKNLPAVLAGDWPIPADWAGGQSNRFRW